MSEHFFSRWSQRKQAVAKGLPVAEPAIPASPVESSELTGPSEPLQRSKPAPQELDSVANEAKPNELATQPLPSLDDARALTPNSDFQPFMRPGVTADVRNVAMKKLFTDPHFNVMDGLDIYIGDYNTPDPMPAGMLQKMVGAQLLGLLDTPDEAAATVEPVLPALSPAAGLRENPVPSPAAPQGAQVVAQSAPPLSDLAGPVSPVLQPHDKAHAEHDHPDLQLQPNHAPASPSPGQSTG